MIDVSSPQATLGLLPEQPVGVGDDPDLKMPVGSGFEELGTRVPDTSALRHLTGWQAELTINDAIDDVIEHERAVAQDMESVSVQSAARDAA